MFRNNKREAPADEASLRRMLRMPVIGGMLIIGVFVVGFAVWASFAPISGAAVASGVVSPKGNRRTVQHFEGGIIRQLLVADGDRVAKGQALVVLEDTQARSHFEELIGRKQVLAAMQARLTAEQGQKDKVRIPDWLTVQAKKDAVVARTVQTQRDLFKTRKNSHESRKAILRKRIAQLRAEIKGLRDHIASQKRQLMLIAEEVDAKRTLVRKGLTPKPDLLALERKAAEIEGARARNFAAIARAKQTIGETELKIVNADNERLDKVGDKLANVRAELAAINEKVFASQDVLRRTVIKAPISGIVVNRRFNTTGGVVRAGAPVLDIVPDQLQLVIEARVRPNDIDVIRTGQSARVHLTAFARNRQSMVVGRVVSVSADALVDEKTKRSYFQASIEVPRSELDKLGKGVTLSPGMPAEVLIVTGERTLMDYLLEPLTDAVRRSFHEQ